MNRLFYNAESAFTEMFDLIMQETRLEYRGNFAGTKAIFNVSFTLQNPLMWEITIPWRKWNPSYAEKEFEWYLSGDRNPAEVEKYAKLWTGMKDEFGFVNSNYGAWWKRNNQLENAILLLKEDPQSRRAIIVHYSPDEIQNYKKDTPCNVVLNFFIVGDELQMTIFARSIDLVYGFCNDQYCFARLQLMVADALGLTVGTMHWFITNLHIYQKHWDLKYNEK